MSLEHPAYWVIYVPESTEDGPAEVAAVAPEVVPSRLLGRDARGLLDQAERYHEDHPDQRIVYLGELTRWLHNLGLKWHDVQVDVFEAMHDLDQHAPHLLIEASPITMFVVADSADRSEIHCTDGIVESTTRHAEPARGAILEVLERDWAPWVRRVLRHAHNGRTVD
jgi:hypothetical protein